MNFKSSQNSDQPKQARSVSRTYVSPVTEPQWKLPSLTSILNIFKQAPRAKAPPSFSLVAANVESSNWPKFKAYDANTEIEEQKKQKDALNKQFDLIKFLDTNRNRGHPPLKLKAVVPNWLVRSNPPSGPGTTGGPGGKPSSADPAREGTRTFDLTSVFYPSVLPEIKSGDRSDVVVAILDTCYPIEQLEKFQKDRPNHELIQNLLGPAGALRGADGKLNVHLDCLEENYLPDVKDHKNYDYNMTDHGLFVAGITNGVAPQAELHLYRVLNKYGLGDVLSIACALNDIGMRFSDRLDKVVINMSLTLSRPQEEAHFTPGDEMGSKILKDKPKPAWFWNLLHWICRILQLFFPRLRCNWQWFDRQTLPLEWLSDLAYVLGPSIVAAAGNNGKNGYRPSALYPAAFDSVLGVGSWARIPESDPKAPILPASYSNLSDTPTTQGVIADGGEAGLTKGIWGVYMGNIPDGTPNGSPNPTGYAWWSGTSFATPIVSGLVAAWVINGAAASTRQAMNIILDLAKKGTNTSAGEWIIPVGQKK